MKYGVCKHPLIPGRAEPSDKAEQVTQLIFGEPYTVLEQQKKWMLVENSFDNYQLWIDAKMHTEIDEKEYIRIGDPKAKRCGDSIGFVTDADGRRFAIPCSAPLPGYSDGAFTLAGDKFAFDGRIARHDSESLVRHAKRLLRAPYLWGGKSIFGMDCSGFVQVVFNCAGIHVPRDAYQQAELGEAIDFIGTTEPGDLVFFDNSEGRITHVGMMLDQERIIHASGSVRIDQIDHQGIYNAETKTYTHQTRIIKRLKLA
jgi:hypothetical protein